jgi:integrase/recombinase XerD
METACAFPTVPWKTLSAYMGHVSPASTEYYLPFVAALAGAASEKFAEHCKPLLDSFQKLGGTP